MTKKPYNMIRILLRAVAVPLAACLFGACSRGETESVPGEEYYDGPLSVTARVEGTLETRTTHPDGVLQPGHDWYLSCPLKEYTTGSATQDVATGMGVLKVGFNAQGQATTFKDKDGKPVDKLTWTMMSPYESFNYLFVLDNVPHKPSALYGFYDNRVYDDDAENNNVARAVIFDEGEIGKYAAGLEQEGEINANDIVQGYLRLPNDAAGKKVYLPLELRHLMARVRVELTAQGINLEEQEVKVWIDHVASESYAMNRLRAAELENSTLIIHPLVKGRGNNFKYNPNCTDTDIYNHTLYLLGSEEQGEKPLPSDGDRTYLTHNLLLPPQSTHTDNSALRPKVHIEVAGKRYSAYLPTVITPGEGGARSFNEFQSGWDITLKADISDAPPHIILSARVQDWNYRGKWPLETRQSGIYDTVDFKNAVDVFKEYAEKKLAEQQDEDALKTLKHRLDRYGSWDDVGMFFFGFFSDIEKDNQILLTYYNVAIEDKDVRSLFGVKLNGHTVYGCVGTESRGAGALKSKMLGSQSAGVANEATLKRALKEFEEYAQFVLDNRDNNKPDVQKQRAAWRAKLEVYGWWVDGTYDTLHIDITNRISGEFPSDLKKINSIFKSYLEFEMNGYTVWECSTPEELKNKVFQ